MIWPKLDKRAGKLHIHHRRTAKWSYRRMQQYTMKTAARALGLTYTVLHHCVAQLKVGWQRKPGGVRLFTEEDLKVIRAYRQINGESGRPTVADSVKLEALRATQVPRSGKETGAVPVSDAAKMLGYSVGTVHRLINGLGLGWQGAPGGPRFLTERDMEAMRSYRARSKPGRKPEPPKAGEPVATLALLQANLERVKPTDRALLKMHLENQMSVSDIAATLGTSRQLIDQKLKGAKRRLLKAATKAQLRAEGRGEERQN